MPKISVVIPAYNEEGRLPRYLDSILDYFGAGDTPYEVIVVDDGSSDGTASIVENCSAQDPNVKLIKLPRNRGKGYAVKTGMLQAVGELRLFADADGATPIFELERLKACLGGGSSVVIASRALKDESCAIKAKLHRKVVGSVFNVIVRMLAVGGIRDTQCGFKLFTAEAAEAVFPLQQTDGFGFDVELLFICRIKGFRVKEQPVSWTDIPKTKVRLVKDSLRMLKDVINIRLNYFRGIYGRG